MTTPLHLACRAALVVATFLVAACTGEPAVPTSPTDSGPSDRRDAGPGPRDAATDSAPPPLDAPEGIDAPPYDAGEPPFTGEMRGVWITRFAYRTQAQLQTVIDNAAAGGFNAVFVQIRGEGDAYYHSTHEPWAARLTGTLGRDPGWDPLRFAIDRAHMHGMELHAYFNALSAAAIASYPIPRAEGSVQHALYTHPEWAAVDRSGAVSTSEYVWFTPGDPAARAHIVATAEELLENYDVDGLHLDRIRTSGRGFSYDPATRAAFDTAHAADPSLTLDAFIPEYMTESINQLVADLYAAIGRARPSVKLSAAVWGIYTRESLGDCEGAVSQGKLDYYQDSVEWLRRGTMDALVPMMYWPIADGRCTDWRRLIDFFMANRGWRHLWAGMHALNLSAGSTWDWDGIRARIDYAREVRAHGTVVFASAYLDSSSGWDDYIGTAGAPGPFAEPAEVPAMYWKP